MPASLNKVFIIGNLTRDPELRYISSGQAVVNFTLAVNRTYTDQNNQKKDEANFIRIITWGKRAEVCNQYLHKGSQVFIEGRLQVRSWQAQDGTKRTTMEVVAQNVQFLGKAGGSKDASSNDVSERQNDVIIDDNFTEHPTNSPINISPEELSPDNDVPF
jgi:single-strand DNA-binding protein